MSRQSFIWFVPSFIPLLVVGMALTTDHTGRGAAVAALAACLFGAAVPCWFASTRGREFPQETEHLAGGLMLGGLALMFWWGRSYEQPLGMMAILACAVSAGAQVPRYLLRRSRTGQDMRHAASSATASPAGTYSDDTLPRA